ncbi:MULTISPECIES: HlyD family secretion protein [unclassified Mesorhizobium]|uniref:HlyD family secretion protein n=1 Tax=unclassified Mesorhizobium TaxID=325217 RepID=UPI0008E93086|nr:MULTISPECIES: HlyD family secretion protein [unclassified Mesorhizobium]RJG46121.1 HlyD family secretion protein [Mesorhizobium sp. DCY119]SFU00806.1 Multidrug resistance efflux pump [Mesorhizobium sp. YR577]
MFKFLRSTATIIAIVIGVAGLALFLYAWRLPPFTSSIQTTENAYVRGQVTIIAPQLAGYVSEVAVQDYQSVKSGQLLVRLDDRIFAQKLEQARATLASQQAGLANSAQQRLSAEARIRASEAEVEGARVTLDNAEASWRRIEPLLKRGVVTESSADTTRSTMEQARATYHQAQAGLEVSRQDLQATIVSRQSLEAAVQGAEAAVHLAEIDLQNTRIVAPEDGRLGEVGARLGQYVSAGTQLVAVVPQRMWIVANFKETQLAGMKIGQPVTMKIDALQRASLTGRIERFSPATGSEFSVLRPDNATGNFTKVSQRLPIRIAIDPGQPLAEHLAPGMSVVVSVDTKMSAVTNVEATELWPRFAS